MIAQNTTQKVEKNSSKRGRNHIPKSNEAITNERALNTLQLSLFNSLRSMKFTSLQDVYFRKIEAEAMKLKGGSMKSMVCKHKKNNLDSSVEKALNPKIKLLISEPLDWGLEEIPRTPSSLFNYLLQYIKDAFTQGKVVNLLL
jgi:hypothetical protein